MGRHTLRLIMVLGALVTLLGGTGIFAVFSDQAVGGVNTATSGSRLGAADLQIAPATVVDGDVSCGTFDEDTTTPQITASNLQPSTNMSAGYVCLRNEGAAALTVTAGAMAIRDVDVACTGDEAASGDATCGSGLAGELSTVLVAHIELVNCAGATLISGEQATIASLASTPEAVGTSALAAGGADPICVRLSVEYPETTREEIVQVAQSDRVDWQFVFEGTAQ